MESFTTTVLNLNLDLNSEEKFMFFFTWTSSQSPYKAWTGDDNGLQGMTGTYSGWQELTVETRDVNSGWPEITECTGDVLGVTGKTQAVTEKDKVFKQTLFFKTSSFGGRSRRNAVKDWGGGSVHSKPQKIGWHSRLNTVFYRGGTVKSTP